MALFVFVIVFTSSASLAQQSVENRLNRLENEIQTLSQALFRDGAQVPVSNAGTANVAGSNNPQVRANTELRLSQLEVDLRNMNGQIEQLSYQMGNMQRDLDRLLAKMELRLSDLEARNIASGGLKTTNTQATQAVSVASGLTAQDVNNAASLTVDPKDPNTFPTGQLGTISVTNVGRNTLAGESNNTQSIEGQPRETEIQVTSLSPADLYDQAFAHLRERKYEDAQNDFQKFVAENPEHNLTPNAQYWLGETYYVRNDFERAARIFAEGYKNYPDGSKGPDNLLKLGMSLAGLGKSEDACLTFHQISKQYANAPTAILTRARQESDKLSCPDF